jgi:prepilin-type N-terminal cleavage/methylation domain-containing protein
MRATGVPPVLTRGLARHISPPRRRQWRAQRGVTLMELLLVLVLLVVAASLVTPAITSAFGGVRLRRSADVVISRWAEARTQAIEPGVVYQFRFTPDTGKYRLEPWTSVEAETAGGSSGTSTAAGAASTGGASGSGSPSRSAADSTAATSDKPDTPATHKTLAESPTIAAVLPESVVFDSGQTAVDDTVRGERRVDALQSTGETWSTPILFFPDGSASNATVVVRNDVPQYVRLTIRGLTGVSRASGVLTRKEFDEGSRTQ